MNPEVTEPPTCWGNQQRYECATWFVTLECTTHGYDTPKVLTQDGQIHTHKVIVLHVLEACPSASTTPTYAPIYALLGHTILPQVLLPSTNKYHVQLKKESKFLSTRRNILIIPQGIIVLLEDLVN
eukprot:GHVR01109292.1.p1 GENE.GHVR01109292.1~~GHVR01109292.1.p1  ORF type:complete len:126 (+),score=24.17 GHVR01109292.1:437-814(+)